MNKNEKNLISHALALRNLTYNNDIKLFYYLYSISICCSTSTIFTIYNGYTLDDKYAERHIAISNLNINIRSFINHWVRCFMFTKHISHVCVYKCYNNTYDLSVVSNDFLYNVIESSYRRIDKSMVYKW